MKTQLYSVPLDNRVVMVRTEYGEEPARLLCVSPITWISEVTGGVIKCVIDWREK